MAINLALAILIPFLFRRLLFHHLHCHRYNLPPGPKPWPIIGNVNLIGPIPHHSLYQLSQKYGPIMHLKLGLKHIVVVSAADIAKVFLKTHGKTFSSRPKTNAEKVHNLQSLQFALGALRATLAPSPQDTHHTTILSGKHGIRTWRRVQVGLSWEEFRRIVDEFFLLNTFGNIEDLIPWLNFMDLLGYTKRMKDISAKFDRFLEHVLKEHEERRKGVEDFVAKDMVDVLLKLAEDPTLEVKLQRHTIKVLTLVRDCQNSFFKKKKN